MTALNFIRRHIQMHRSASRAIFLLLILSECILAIFLASTHRIPSGHDTLQEFTLKFYFLNSAATAGEIPLWMPFMTQGTLANWWYFIQGGLLQNIALTLGQINQYVGFLHLYYFEAWLEQAILVLGTWLLGQRFFKTLSARFFVAFTVLYTTIWLTQIWFNIRLIYAIPLVIYLLEIYLTTFASRHLFAAAFLFALQWIGNLPYVIPLQALFISIYLVLRLTAEPTLLRSAIAHWKRFPLRPFIALLPALVPLIWGYTILNSGTEWIVSYNEGRNPDGTVGFEAFRSYGTTLGLTEWKSVMSPSPLLMGPSLFLGYLTVAFAAIGLLSQRHRIALHLAALIFFFMLFAAGEPSIFMRLIYDGFPGMHYFRHVSFAAVFVKFSIIMLAGLGLDLLLTKSLSRVTYVVLLASAVAIGAWAIWFVHYWGGIAAVGLVGIAAGLRLDMPRQFVGLIVFAIHIPTLAQYKYEHSIADTTPLQARDRLLTDYQRIPYSPMRCASTLAPQSENLRHQRFVPFINPEIGTTYWSNESFMFVDCMDSPYRTDHLLLPLDQYLRVYWEQAGTNPSTPPRARTQVNLPMRVYLQSIYGESPTSGSYAHGIPFKTKPYFTIRFPDSNEAAMRISGVLRPKLQVFSQAFIASSRDEVTEIISDSRYRGNFLLVQSPAATPTTILSVSQQALERAWSLPDPAPVQHAVEQFDANGIRISLNVPPADGQQWLLYSDTWHPNWRAWVNESPTPVYLANIAYKAVPVMAGHNVVEFRIASHSISNAYVGAAFASLLGLALIGATATRVGLKEDEN